MEIKAKFNKENINNFFNETINNIDLILLVYGVILGVSIPIFGLEIMGVSLTVYRCLIPLMTLFYLYKRFSEKNDKHKVNKIAVYFLAFLVFWCVYGGVGLLISPYSDFATGAKELFDIALGGMSVYCFIEICTSKEKIDYVFRVIKFLIVILCVIALIEIIGDYHLWISKYSNGELRRAFGSRRSIYFATTIFFNPNDFCAFLSIFAPFFLISDKKTKKQNIFDSIILMIIFYILAVNDATITVLSLFIGIIIYLFIGKIGKLKSITQLAINIISFLWIPKILNYIISWGKSVYAYFFQQSNFGGIGHVPEITEAVGEQIANAVQGHGSLFMRVQVTLDSFNMVFDSYLLGIGPGAFSNYMKQTDVHSSLFDPHNLWLEILSQYGIVVFALFVSFIVVLCVQLYKYFIKEKASSCIVLVSCFCIYLISSIAPSSFLGYSYQWILFGLALAVLNRKKEDCKNETV